MAYNTAVAGTVLTAAFGNTNWRDQVVSQFASASARNAAITSPVEGMLATIADVDQFTAYSGAAWVTVASYGAWSTYTPALASDGGSAPSLGNGTIAGRYAQYGKTIRVYITLLFGSTTSWGSGEVTFSLPVTAATINGNRGTTGTVHAFDASPAGRYTGTAQLVTTTTVLMTSGGGGGAWGATTPITFANGDEISLSITYEAA